MGPIRNTLPHLACYAALLVSPAAGAGVIFEESFEGSGQYTVTGGGARGKRDFFSVLPGKDLRLGFTPGGISGDHYFGARDLDSRFGGTGGRRALRAIDFDQVDLRYSVNAKAHISLAARDGRRVFGPGDYVRILISLDGKRFRVVDQFLGTGRGRDRALVSRDHGRLSSDFASFSYAIPDIARSIDFRVEVLTTRNRGAVAIDRFYVTNNRIPEPAMLALLGLGLAGLAYGRRRTR